MKEEEAREKKVVEEEKMGREVVEENDGGDGRGKGRGGSRIKNRQRNITLST